jgi:acetylglutamate/LysW-gamma-L-alpha-aminoadipate kinase
MLLIKIGGGQTINWEGVCQDIKLLWEKEKVILVHGASKTRNELAQKLGVQVKTVTSPSGIQSVYTDQELLDVFLMAYPGLVNKKIVALLQRNGLEAIGLSGVDGRLWQAKPKKDLLVQEENRVKLLTGNLTGRVEIINVNLIKLLLDHNYLPVICSPAISFEGEIVNTDNDWAVAMMAEALKVKRLVILFDKPGLLRDLSDETTLIKRIDKDRLEDFFQYAAGRMQKKIMGIKRAIEGGVEAVFLSDGRAPSPVLSALAGLGTVIN